MEGTMRHSILFCLSLCITTGAASRTLAAEVDNEPVFERRPLSSWIASLRDGDAKVRARGAYVLGVIGPEARRAIPSLLRALHDNDASVRVLAASSLSVLQAEAEIMVPNLIRMLSSEDPQDGAIIAFALGRYGPRARDAVPALAQVLQSPHRVAHGAAARALGEIGPGAEEAAPALIKCLADSIEREYAANALFRIGSRAAPALRNALSDESELVRVRAALMLLDIAKHKVAVAVLPAVLMPKDLQVKSEAVRAIGEMGRDADAAIPALVAAFTSPSQEIRPAAEKALVRLGSRSLPMLLSALGHNDELVRMHAASALGFIPDQCECSLPSLVGLLEDPSPAVRAEAAKSLGSFEHRATLAVPALRRALKDDYIRGLAAIALGRIGPAAYSAVPDLIEGLEDPTNPSRAKAASGLGDIGERAAAANAALQKALKADDADLRWRAAHALGQIKGKAATTVSALTKALGDKDVVVRCHAAESLARYGAAARDAVPLLGVLFRDGQDDERCAAADALKAIDPDAAATAGVKLWELAKTRGTTFDIDPPPPPKGMPIIAGQPPK
jgi:HEAT repeat protein